MKKAIHSLRELSTDLGFPIAALPIYVSKDAENNIAYTTRRGIFLDSRILEKYPEEVKVYVAHEIFHWVIDTSAIYQKYSSAIVGYATDYRINSLIKELYGYDVHKVSLPGIYRKDFKKRTLPEIARRLRAEGKLPNTKPCGGIGFPHPLIAECALHLRAKLNLPDVPKEPFVFEGDMNEQFFGALASFDTTKIYSHCPIDLLITVRAIWAALYAEKPKHTAQKGDTLFNVHPFVYSIPYDMIRSRTVGDATYSLWVAAKLVTCLDEDSNWIAKSYYRAKNSVQRASDILATKLSKLLRKKVERNLELAKIRVLKWKATPRIATLFSTPTNVANDSRGIRMSCLLHTEIEADETWLPSLRSNELIRRMRRHSTQMISELLGSSQLMEDIQSALGENLDTYADNESEEHQKTQAEKPKKEQPEKSEPSDENEENDSESADADNNGDDSDESGEGGSNKADSETGTDESDENESSVSETDSENSGFQAGSAARDPVANAAKFKNYDLGYDAADVLSRIYESFVEVETMLQKIRSRVRSPDDFGQDAIYEYGNDASRAVSEELALLQNKYTKLLFLSRMSQHELLLRAPQKKARSATILALDASGSMGGRHYAKAVGYVLAVMKWMHKEKRGLGIIMFSSQIDSEYYVEAGKPLSLTKILSMALRPSFGGTCFDTVIPYSFRKAKELNWKKVNVQLITDGGDTVRCYEDVMEAKGKDNKLISMVTSKQTQGIAEVSDEIYYVKGDSMHIDLVKMSGTLFS